MRSAMRSASSTTMTQRRPCDGLRLATVTRSRTSSILMVTSSVATSVTSGCVPASVVRHAWQRPQPPCSHWSAAANARAAFERPEPGGREQPRVGIAAAVAAARSVATACLPDDAVPDAPWRASPAGRAGAPGRRPVPGA